MSRTQGSQSGNERSRIDKGFIERLRKQADQRSAASDHIPSFAATKGTRIDDRLQAARRRKQEIANENAEKDQRLKEQTLQKLFRFLLAETAIIFLFAFLQGFGVLWRWKFHLDDWSFRIVVGATIGQITAMLIIAVQHLFPKNSRN